MSDYLANLAIRNTATGRDAVIQPRLPAMYEALSPSTDSAGDGLLSTMTDQGPRRAASDLHGILRPGDQQARGANPLVEFHQPPASPSSDDGRAATKAGPQQVSLRPPGDQVASPAQVAPGAFRRHELARPRAEITAQGPPDLTKQDGSAPEGTVEARERKITRLGKQSPYHEPARPPADPAAVQPSLDLNGPNESGSEGIVEVHPQKISRMDKKRARHEPARAPADRAAAQRPLDLTKPDESGSEGTVDTHRRGVIRPDEETPRGTTERIQIEAQRLSSQGATASADRSRVEVRQTDGNEKEIMPDSVTAFPPPSSRASLQVQGPVPALSPPPRRHRQSDETPATGMPGGEQPPIVRVSIGRVEVRAILPPPPAEQPSPPGPRMSLDEYLQRQDEAKR